MPLDDAGGHGAGRSSGRRQERHRPGASRTLSGSKPTALPSLRLFLSSSPKLLSARAISSQPCHDCVVDRTLRVVAGRIGYTGRNAGQQLNAFVDRRDGPDVELLRQSTASITSSRNINSGMLLAGDHDPLLPGQAARVADFEEALRSCRSRRQWAEPRRAGSLSP